MVAHRRTLRVNDVSRLACQAFTVAFVLATMGVRAGETSPPVSSPALASQVRAIFQAKCVECHGPDVAKPKGRFGYVLDLARVAANPKMVVPGNSTKSELYQMVFHNEMPDPKGTSLPLTPEEKNIVKAWIDAGALVDGSPNGSSAPPKLTFFQRVLRDIGQFHPPTTHFPIALLIAAIPAELMLLLTKKDSWREIVRFCVVLGAISAVVAATLGWCDAAVSHYRDASADVLEWHRRFGTVTAMWAVALIAMLKRSDRNGNVEKRRTGFRVMLVIGAALVSIAGYLGASLIYGLDHYTW